MPIVKMPDGQQVRFPDDMPSEQIQSMISSKFPEVAEKKPKSFEEMKQMYGSMDPISDTLQSASLGFTNMPVQALMGLADLAGRPLGMRAPKIDLKKYAPQKGTFEAFNFLGGGQLPFAQARKGAGLVEKGLNLAAQGGLYGALFGSQEDDIAGGAERGAVTAPFVGGALHMLGQGAQKVMSYLPQNMQRKVFDMLKKGNHLTPEKISRAKAIHSQFQEKGIPADLMTLLDSPEGIKMLDSIIRTVPENVAGPMIKTTLEAENRMINNLAEHLAGGTKPEELDATIKNEIQDYYNPIKEKASGEWRSLRKDAAKTKLKENKKLDDYINSELRKKESAGDVGEGAAISDALYNILKSYKPKYSVEYREYSMPEPGRQAVQKRKMGNVGQGIETYQNIGQKYRDTAQTTNQYDNSVIKEFRKLKAEQINQSLQGTDNFDKWVKLRSEHQKNEIPFRTKTFQDILQPKREVNEQKYIDNLLNDENRAGLSKLPQKTVNKILLKHIMQKHPNSFGDFAEGRFGRAIFPENLSSSKILNTLTSKNFDLKAGKLLDETTKKHIGHIMNFKDITKDYRIMAKNIFGTGRDVTGQLEDIKGKTALDPAMIGIATGSPKKALEALAYKQLKGIAEERGPQALREFAETIFDPEYIESILGGEVPKSDKLASAAKKIKGAKRAQQKGSQAATLQAIFGVQKKDRK